MNKKYLTIREAAEIIGVTPLTLRNWDKSGQFTAHRHPINNYRIYKTETIKKLLNEIETGGMRRLKTQQPKIKKLQVKFLKSN